jgi:hypothetical protein
VAGIPDRARSPSCPRSAWSSAGHRSGISRLPGILTRVCACHKWRPTGRGTGVLFGAIASSALVLGAPAGGRLQPPEWVLAAMLPSLPEHLLRSSPSRCFQEIYEQGGIWRAALGRPGGVLDVVVSAEPEVAILLLRRYVHPAPLIAGERAISSGRPSEWPNPGRSMATTRPTAETRSQMRRNAQRLSGHGASSSMVMSESVLLSANLTRTPSQTR